MLVRPRKSTRRNRPVRRDGRTAAQVIAATTQQARPRAPRMRRRVIDRVTRRRCRRATADGRARTSRLHPMASSRCSTSAWPGSKQPEPGRLTFAGSLTGTGRISARPAYMEPGTGARPGGGPAHRHLGLRRRCCSRCWTGQRVFQGESAADAVAAVIPTEAGPVYCLPPSTPWYVRATIKRCLQEGRARLGATISRTSAGAGGRLQWVRTALPSARKSRASAAAGSRSRRCSCS